MSARLGASEESTLVAVAEWKLRALGSARLDLRLEPEDKTLIVSAAALMGVEYCGLVRPAGRVKALGLLERETQLKVSCTDFNAFAALGWSAASSAWLQNALEETAKRVCRA